VTRSSPSTSSAQRVPSHSGSQCPWALCPTQPKALHRQRSALANRVHALSSRWSSGLHGRAPRLYRAQASRADPSSWHAPVPSVTSRLCQPATWTRVGVKRLRFPTKIEITQPRLTGARLCTETGNSCRLELSTCARTSCLVEVIAENGTTRWGECFELPVPMRLSCKRRQLSRGP